MKIIFVPFCASSPKVPHTLNQILNPLTATQSFWSNLLSREMASGHFSRTQSCYTRIYCDMCSFPPCIFLPFPPRRLCTASKPADEGSLKENIFTHSAEVDFPSAHFVVDVYKYRSDNFGFNTDTVTEGENHEAENVFELNSTAVLKTTWKLNAKTLISFRWDPPVDPLMLDLTVKTHKHINNTFTVQ